jgi:hypothetical protein
MENAPRKDVYGADSSQLSMLDGEGNGGYGSIELVTAQNIDLFGRDFQGHRQLSKVIAQSPLPGPGD